MCRDPVQCAYRFGARSFLIFVLAIGSCTQTTGGVQRSKFPAGGRPAIVIDERLAVLRDAPALSANVLKRLSRGRRLAIASARRSRDGILFLRVAVTSRTRGWIQADSLVVPGRRGDDSRLFDLILASKGFDRIARARIFLDFFRTSRYRPSVLLRLGDEAQRAAEKLSLEAERRLDIDEMAATRAPLFSYYLNYSGLDRYRRQGVGFVFDKKRRRLFYDGVAWREIVRKYGDSPQAIEARMRLTELEAVSAN